MIFQILPTINSNSFPSQNTAPKESRYPIFVALERGLNVSAEANIQPASDRVTNIGYLLSLGASLCLRQIPIYTFSAPDVFRWSLVCTVDL